MTCGCRQAPFLLRPLIRALSLVFFGEAYQALPEFQSDERIDLLSGFDGLIKETPVSSELCKEHGKQHLLAQHRSKYFSAKMSLQEKPGSQIFTPLEWIIPDV